MNLFVYSDESGVFDKYHYQFFVFAGLIIPHTANKEMWARKYSSAEKSINSDNKYGDTAFNRAMRDRYKVRSQMLAAYRIVFPKTEILPGISGREFRDGKALAHALWGDWYASDV